MLHGARCGHSETHGLHGRVLHWLPFRHSPTAPAPVHPSHIGIYVVIALVVSSSALRAPPLGLS